MNCELGILALKICVIDVAYRNLFGLVYIFNIAENAF